MISKKVFAIACVLVFVESLGCYAQATPEYKIRLALTLGTKGVGITGNFLTTVGNDIFYGGYFTVGNPYFLSLAYGVNLEYDVLTSPDLPDLNLSVSLGASHLFYKKEWGNDAYFGIYPGVNLVASGVLLGCSYGILFVSPEQLATFRVLDFPYGVNIDFGGEKQSSY